MEVSLESSARAIALLENSPFVEIDEALLADLAHGEVKVPEGTHPFLVRALRSAGNRPIVDLENDADLEIRVPWSTCFDMNPPQLWRQPLVVFLPEAPRTFSLHTVVDCL